MEFAYSILNQLLLLQDLTQREAVCSAGLKVACLAQTIARESKCLPQIAPLPIMHLVLLTWTTTEQIDAKALCNCTGPRNASDPCYCHYPLRKSYKDTTLQYPTEIKAKAVHKTTIQ